VSTSNEVEILRIIQKQGKATSRGIGGLMGISSGYAGFLLATLADRGLLRKEKGIEYVFTPAGVDELISGFNYSRGRLVARVEWMTGQVERINEEIAKLESLKRGMKKAEKVTE